MSAVDHATIEELLAVRALDALDGEDAAELERALAEHGPACEECRRLERAFGDVAARLAFALEPIPVDAAMADRIIGSSSPSSSSGAAPPPTGGHPGAGPRDELEARRSRRQRRAWVGLAGIAAAVVLVAVMGVTLLSGRTQPVTRVASAQEIVEFEGRAGELAMAYVPGQAGAVFWGRDLPDPGEGRVYEIWMIEGDSATKGGCVEPLDGRVGVVVDADIGTTETMAVTVESEACPDAPTSEPILTASLA